MRDLNPRAHCSTTGFRFMGALLVAALLQMGLVQAQEVAPPQAESLLLRGNLDSKLEQALKTMLTQARRAGEMTSQLLSVSRPIQLQLEPVRLNPLLEETLEGVSFRPEFDRVTVVKELSPELPLVHGDRKRLIEVFSNLFNNLFVRI